MIILKVERWWSLPTWCDKKRRMMSHKLKNSIQLAYYIHISKKKIQFTPNLTFQIIIPHVVLCWNPQPWNKNKSAVWSSVRLTLFTNPDDMIKLSNLSEIKNKSPIHWVDGHKVSSYWQIGFRFWLNKQLNG